MNAKALSTWQFLRVTPDLHFRLRRRIQAPQAKVSFTFCRTALLRLGFRYLMVDSMSVCPIQSCTVRRSTPFHKCHVAKVARNLCSQELLGSSFARLAISFRYSRKWVLGLQPAVGNRRLQPTS